MIGTTLHHQSISHILFLVASKAFHLSIEGWLSFSRKCGNSKEWKRLSCVYVRVFMCIRASYSMSFIVPQSCVGLRALLHFMLWCVTAGSLSVHYTDQCYSPSWAALHKDSHVFLAILPFHLCLFTISSFCSLSLSLLCVDLELSCI